MGTKLLQWYERKKWLYVMLMAGCFAIGVVLGVLAQRTYAYYTVPVVDDVVTMQVVETKETWLLNNYEAIEHHIATLMYEGEKYYNSDEGVYAICVGKDDVSLHLQIWRNGDYEITLPEKNE